MHIRNEGTVWERLRCGRSFANLVLKGDIENEYNEIEPNVIQLDEIERYELDDTESGYDEIEPIESMPNKIELNEIDQNEINNNDIESNKVGHN